MKQDPQQILLTVNKILKRKQMCGPDLYEVHVSIPTIHPSTLEVKQSKITNNPVFFTEKHLVPTTEGFKSVNEVQKGDTIICSINVMIT